MQNPKTKKIMIVELAEGTLDLNDIYVKGDSEADYDVQMFSAIPSKKERSRSKSNPKQKKPKRTKTHLKKKAQLKTLQKKSLVGIL